MDETINLGGNIQLTGFNSLDRSQMVILKKIVGSYARRMSEIADKFESLSIVMKSVHKTEASEKYDIHAKVLNDGKPLTSEVTDRNLFVAVDSSLKKIVNEIQK